MRPFLLPVPAAVALFPRPLPSPAVLARLPCPLLHPLRTPLLALLRTPLLALLQAIVDATGDAAATIRHGETLYADKPTMKAHHGALGTWSDEEYAHPGLQAVYLRLKSFQRFTESWALFERAARRGVFDRYLTGVADAPTLHVASLGGGPGYELLAFEWFLEFWQAAGRHGLGVKSDAWLRACRDLGAGAPGFPGGGSGAGAGGSGGDDDEGGTGGGGGGDDEGGTGGGGGTGSEDTGGGSVGELTAAAAAVDVSDTAGPDSTTGGAGSASAGSAVPCLPPMRLASLDLQPSWEPYVLALPGARSTSQYSFAQWNIKESVDAVARSGCPSIELCIIS